MFIINDAELIIIKVMKKGFIMQEIICGIVAIIMWAVMMGIWWLFQRSATFSALKKYENWKKYESWKIRQNSSSEERGG